MDSIHASIHTHYSSLGVTIIQDPDQYSTDFTKSLEYLRTHTPDITSRTPSSHSSNSESKGNGRLEILILGGLGGRVDQAFSQIHHLYLMTRSYSSDRAAGNLYLVSEESLTFVLQPGRNVIRTPKTNRPISLPGSTTDSTDIAGDCDHLLEENVGIIPISGPARITTKGFQWDVEDWATEIGGQLSTSNHIRADVVEVTAEVPILFTVELAKRFKRVR